MAEPQEVVVVEEEQSLDDQIRDDYREITARLGKPEDEEAQATETPADPATPAKARDESGKFVKADKTAKIGTKPVSAKPASLATDEPHPPGGQGADEAQPLPSLAGEPAPTLPDGRPIDLSRPPSSFKPAAKAVWAQVPEAVRADIYRRESEHHAGYRGIKESADFGQSMKAVIDPYMALITNEGGTPDRAVASLLQTAATLRMGTPQQKQAAVMAIVRQYGVELPQAQPPQLDANGQPITPQQPPQFLDPRVDQILGSLQAQERERQEQANRQSNDATERFLATKSEDGQPAYPFVDNVLQDMISRTSEIRRNSPALSHEDVLKQAYEAAVWANPETRAVLIAQQQAKAQQSAENLRKVEQAKRANANNLPKRGSLPATAPLGTMDDTIRETYRNLTANL